MGCPDTGLLLGGKRDSELKADPRISREELIFIFVFSGPASIVYDESGNKELEDDRDSQDDISVLPPSRYASRAPSMAPSRIHPV